MAEQPEKVPLEPEDTSPPPPYPGLGSFADHPYPQQPHPADKQGFAQQQYIYPQQECVYPPQGGAFQAGVFPPQQGFFPQHQGVFPLQQQHVPGHGVVVWTQPNTVTVVPEVERPPSPVVPIVFSCFVIWCCCWPIGLLAFIFALCSAGTTDVHKARQRQSAANTLSVMGVVAGVLLAFFVIIYEICVA